jgi:uncharacterized protein YbjT (DUF2867 family)
MARPGLQICAYFRGSDHGYTISVRSQRRCCFGWRLPNPKKAGNMILVTGASGSVGKEVLQQVTKTGAQHRAMYRSAAEAAKAPAGTETVVADFAKRDTLAAALAGVDTAYLVCSPIPELVQLESNMIDACVAAGVKHLVLNSAMGAGDYPKSFPSWHRKVEDKLQRSGLSWTILRPNSFHQNTLAYFAPSIRAQGAFYGSMGNSRNSFLDARDIAAVAVSALHAGDHSGKVYELNGPEALSYTDLAAKISRHAGREVKYVDIPAEAQRKAMLDQGMPEWQVDALLDLQLYYVHGQGGDTDGVLQGLLGRAPITMDEFLKENAGAFRAEAATA